MLEIGHLEKDQVWIMTSSLKRIGKILEVAPIGIEEKEVGQPPVTKVYPAAKVLVTSPIYPIPGHVDDEEAAITEKFRRVQKQNTKDDMWTETWIEIQREKPPIDNPKEPSKSWQKCIQVYKVEGRSKINESYGKGSSITNTIIDAVLIPPEHVHQLMFTEIDLDEMSQAEKEKALERKEIREEILREMKAKEALKKRGDPVNCKEWGPRMRILMQLEQCGIPVPGNEKDGTWIIRCRTALKEHLVALGINPWEVMELKKDDFAEALLKAKKEVMVAARTVHSPTATLPAVSA